MHPKLAELKTALLRSRDTHIAEVVAVSGAFARRQALRAWLREEQVRVVPLRPPEPWEPLAPLRQLLGMVGLEVPALAPEELGLESLWLGTSTIRTRLFLRTALLLGPHPTCAVVRLSDLNDLVWGLLLNYVRQGRLHMPVTFFLEADSGQRIPPVALRLDLDALPDDALPTDKAGGKNAAPRGMGKRALAYLALSRFFGDSVRPKTLQALTRADGKRHLQSLKLAGLVSSSGRLIPEKLFDLELPPLPRGRQWALRAWRVLQRRKQARSSRGLWLLARLGSNVPIDVKVDEKLAARVAVELGDRTGHEILSKIPAACLETPASAILGLLGIDRGHYTGAEAVELSKLMRRVGAAYGPLLVARLTMRLGKRDGGRQIAACRDKLKSGGNERLASILSLELARWHLAHWRVRPSLQAIGTCAETDHWVVGWMRNIAMAEAYIKMDRLDFARTHVQKALATPPRPLSPILKSDIYITMGQLFTRAGFENQAESALEKSRETYISARDGVRMGRYLIVRGEMYWRAKDMEMSKQTFSRSVRILNQLESGLLAREAELKLALILQGVAAETVGA